MLKNKKILPIVVILLIIIISGIAVLCIKGMNYGLSFGNNTTIKIGFNEKTEIEDIIKEIFGKQYKIETLNDQENNVLITVKSASEEQINTLVQKVNEKYSINKTTSELELTNNPKIDVKNLILPYVTPVMITFILIILYFVVKYKKIGILTVLVYTLSISIGMQLLYLSIYAIMRIPVNELTMPISIFLFILSFVILVEIFEKSKIKDKK